MLHTISPQDMQEMERAFLSGTGYPSLLLMEHAAQAVCNCLERFAKKGDRVLFVCGGGNNGGDGCAAARIWMQRGGKADVWLLTSPSRMKGDAGENARLLNVCGAGMTILYGDAPEIPEGAAAIVDALFGTGLCRMIDGAAQALINLVNEAGKPIIAVDIPSGVDGTTGEARAMGPILAIETVTFHRIKQGLLLGAGPVCAGEITVQPILIPPAEDDVSDGLMLCGPGDLRRMIPSRAADCHKGDFGRVVIFAGSEGMAGAAAFCASACVKAGAGLTTILCRRSLLPVLQTLAPEAMCRALPEENGHLLPEAARIAREALRGADAACIGCGLGQSIDNLMLLRAFREAECPVVWDADALNLLARHEDLLPLSEQDVITPHPGEAARLLEQDTEDVTDAPLAALDALHELTGCTVLLKGPRTLISDGLTTYVNRHASPALAKGGSGDVLAGIIAALLARRALSSVECGALGALIHGLAGIRAEKEAGENCATPQMLVRHIRLDADML